jgi:hypothetical protein
MFIVIDFGSAHDVDRSVRSCAARDACWSEYSSRTFQAEMLGLFEVPKPAHLAKRGADHQALRPCLRVGRRPATPRLLSYFVDDPFGNRIELMTAGYMI